MAFEALTAYMTAKNQKAPQQAPQVSVEQAGRDAATANLNNMPYIEALMSRGNKFNQAQNNALLEQAVSGYGKWSGQMGKNAQAYSEGRLSDEQAGNLSRIAAERGISTGRRGQAGQFSLLRDFGIDQYQSGAASQNIMQSLVGMAKVNPMSPLSMMVSSQDALGVAESNRSATQAWLNAEQASQNVRKNAFWSGLAAGDATFQQASGYGQGGGNAQGGGGMGGMMKMFGKKGGGGSGGGDGGWGGGTSGMGGDSFSGGDWMSAGSG